MGLPGSDPLKLDTEPDKFTAGAICLRYGMRRVSQKVRRDPDLFNGQGRFGREKEKCSEKKSVYGSSEHVPHSWTNSEYSSNRVLL